MSASSSFIANAHNELHVKYMPFLHGKRQLAGHNSEANKGGGGRPHRPFEFPTTCSRQFPFLWPSRAIKSSPFGDI